MSDLTRGSSFTDGAPGDVTAAKLQALVDSAVINPSFITGKPNVTPVTTDSALIYQTANTRIAKTLLSGIVSLVPTGAAAGTPSLRALGTTGTTAAAGNDVRFPASLTGLRKANGVSADTVAQAQDLNFPCVNVTGTALNWALGQIFWKTLSANTTFTFTNVTDGATVVFIIQSNGHTVTFPTLTGAVPAPTPGSTLDIYSFLKCGGWLIGAVKSV